MKQILVKFMISWLKFTTKIQLLKNKPTIIGITGSAGKTSTTLTTALILQSRYQVKFSEKGNSETGIPMVILNIAVKDYVGIDWLLVIIRSFISLIFYWPKYEFLVLEMGIDSDRYPKNMSHLLTFLKPKVGVFLNVNSVHGQNYHNQNTLQAIANEKGKLLISLPQDGLAIYSNDHPEIVKFNSLITAKQLLFSTSNQTEIQLLKHQVSLAGTNFNFLHHKKIYNLNFKNQLHFKESFGTFASALLVGYFFDIDIPSGINILEKKYHIAPGRMNLIAGINHSLIIDSSYNSSLEPTVAALKLLGSLTSKGKKIAVLGDMREIGPNEKKDHQQLAFTAANQAQVVILIGPLTKQYSLPILKKSQLAQKNIYAFDNAYQAIPILKQIINHQDIILIKGSQNTIFLEIIVKAMMQQPDKAKQLLCRQTKYFEQKRNNILKNYQSSLLH